MFDGSLGVYPHKKFHIDIEPDAKPVYARPYPVPRMHLSTFKKELDHLVKLGVLFIRTKVNGHRPLSSFLKRIDEYAGSATCANSIR